MLGGIGMAEVAIIGAIALLIFGPRQLPKFARSIGETIREMKKAGKAVTEGIEDGAGAVMDCDIEAVSTGIWRCVEHRCTMRQEQAPRLCDVAKRRLQQP